jgi:hypothetical protein
VLRGRGGGGVSSEKDEWKNMNDKNLKKDCTMQWFPPPRSFVP